MTNTIEELNKDEKLIKRMTRERKYTRLGRQATNDAIELADYTTTRRARIFIKDVKIVHIKTDICM